MRSLVVPVVLLLAAVPLSGCLDNLLGNEAGPTVRSPTWSMEVPVTIHVVAVGFDGALDGAQLLADLPVTRPLHNLVELGTTRSINLEPVGVRLDWRFHEAPAAFADGFFAAAKAASFDGPAPAFLVEYDRNSGQGRLPQGPLAATPLGMTPLGGLGSMGDARMDYIHVLPVEDWVAANRAAHGLEFGGASYTIFLVDSWSKAPLPQERYHYWYFDDGTIDADLATERSVDPSVQGLDKFHTPKDPTSMRAWGGHHDFAWIDVGAAPSWLDNTPWFPPFEDDNVDHPLWDLEGQEEKLHRNLNRHLGDFALVKILRTPIYDFEWVEKWVFPVHVFIQSEGLSNRKEVPRYGVDVETWLLPERIEKAFEDLAPWVDTEVTVEYHWLPQDDPGMAAAVRRAKVYGNPSVVSSGVIEDHVRTNWDAYVPAESPGVRVLPQFLFYLDGVYTFWGMNQGGGYAAGDGWGRAWAGFDHVFDVCANPGMNLQGSCFGTKAQKWRGEGTMDMLVIHEGGHHVGLTHARDTSILNDEGDDEYYANWLWDSVASVMTYRHQNPAFDRWDRDITARGHAGWTLDLTAKRLVELAGTAPAAETAASGGIARSEQLLRDGRWQDAAREAIATWKGLVAMAGPLGAGMPETTVESFGGTAFYPLSPGAGGSFGPVPAPVGIPDQHTDLNHWGTTIEIKEGALWFHSAFQDTRPDAGAARFAYLVLFDEDMESWAVHGNDVFSEAYVTNLPPPGTYTVVLVTAGGVASEYEVVLDVHYAG